ncbi:MAG: Matrixin [Isosphaeraceae bacterium]
MPRRLWLITALAVLCWPCTFSVAADEPPKKEPEKTAEPSPNVTEVPPFDEFLVIPLRLHVLKSKHLPEIDCALTDADLDRVLGKVNGIWHKAGIHWGLESVVREPAAGQEKFRLAAELQGARNLGLYRLLVPEETHLSEGLNVYYLHRFAVNGVWLGGGVAFVQETARLKEVEGGIDEPLPRVTAHELGHALGLPHRQDRTNLLASGTTGTLLNAKEVETARRFAARRKGTVKAGELSKLAESAEPELAKRLRTWLGQIPGGEGKAKAERKAPAQSGE